jgi:hypothetical protein
MRRRTRWTRAGKWAGVVTLAVIAILWLGSGWFAAYRIWPTGQGEQHLQIGGGIVLYYHSRDRLEPTASTGCFLRSAEFRAHWRWVPVRFGHQRGTSMTEYMYLPLWVPWVAVLFPTVWLWFFDRRPPGSCAKCGYDLKGNTTGVCPECGAKAGGR